VGGIPTFFVVKAGGTYSAHYAVREGFVGGVLFFVNFYSGMPE
jgi:hypothetical protein